MGFTDYPNRAYPYTNLDITKQPGVQLGIEQMLGTFVTTNPASITSIRIGSSSGNYLTLTYTADLDDASDQADTLEFLDTLFPDSYSVAGHFDTNPTITVRGDATPDWTAAFAATPLTNGAVVTKTGTPVGVVAYLRDHTAVGTIVHDYGPLEIDPGIVLGTNHRRDVSYDSADYNPALAVQQDPPPGKPSHWPVGYDLYAIDGAQGYWGAEA